MESHGRRRRGRGRAAPTPVVVCRPRKSSVFSFLCNFVIISSLVLITYYMLEYQCQNCNRKCEAQNISKTINDIAENLFIMKDSYNDLEMKILKLSRDLPKIQGQIDVLESLAKTIKNNCVYMKARALYNIDDKSLLSLRESNSSKIIRQEDVLRYIY